MFVHKRLSFHGISPSCWSPDWPLTTGVDSDKTEVCIRWGHSAAIQDKTSCPRGLGFMASIYVSLCLFLPIAGKKVLTLQSRSCESTAGGTDFCITGIAPSPSWQPSRTQAKGSMSQRELLVPSPAVRWGQATGTGAGQLFIPQ